MITTLLKAGAKIEAQDTTYGATALQYAARYNQNLEVIMALPKAGADLKARDNRRGKAAHRECQIGTEALPFRWGRIPI